MMQACRNRPDPHIPDPMAGSSLNRARKQGVRLADGGIIALRHLTHREPALLMLSGALSGWRRSSSGWLGMPLDRVTEILLWDHG